MAGTPGSSPAWCLPLCDVLSGARRQSAHALSGLGDWLTSYWLIGYYYQKPEAVNAAKKAFIVNRIGDLGLALAIYLIWSTFGTIQYNELMTIRRTAPTPRPMAAGPSRSSRTCSCWPHSASRAVPLYVWLPDAMEGPTPFRR